MIIWLTGQPGAGKTVLAKLLIENLVADFHIDGDDLRALTANKNYGIKGRIENVGRAQTIAHYLHNYCNNLLKIFILIKISIKTRCKERYFTLSTGVF